MKEINLANINTALMECEKNLQTIIPDMYRAEMEYNSRYFDLLLHSMGGSAPVREADAKKTLELEPVYERYHSLKMKIRQLYSEKDTLTTVASNLRNMSYGNS